MPHLPTVSDDTLLNQMQAQIQVWQARADDKALFLRCYYMMTSNMLAAVDEGRFADPVWVRALLHHFAGYYFDALTAYEQNISSVPQIWRTAHEVTRSPQISALQKVLLGINAHINYDLVLALVDMLEAEWPLHSAEQRGLRYQDHCLVNEIIGQTIDAVQDEILEPAMNLMAFFDLLLGPVDEILCSRLIAHWRENVWRHAASILENADPQLRQASITTVHEGALRLAEYIVLSQRE